MFKRMLKYFLFELNITGCSHFHHNLKVLSKDRQIQLTDDELFEVWECACKCKCGKVVIAKFSYLTDKFKIPFKDLKGRKEDNHDRRTT